MKIKPLFTKNDDITIESYLHAYGISNMHTYLNPPTSVLDDCYIYDNIKEAVDNIKYCLLNDLSFGIIQDSDTDGICSAYMMYKYIKYQNKNCKVKIFLQNGKERGLDNETLRQHIIDYKPSCLIIPDAGTNSREYEDTIIDNDICMIVADHHKAEKDKVCQRAIVINNTMNSIECNRELSGTGVTFKLIQAIDKDMNTKYSNRFIDLVGLSIISDCMDVKTYENRWFIKYILDINHIHNPFLSELFDRLPNEYTQKDISFKIIPMFNSVIRSGTTEDKQKLFMAFNGNDMEETISMCESYHRKQIDRVADFVRHHADEIEEQADSNITIIDANDVPQSFSGLIAGKISGMTNKPCIVGKSINKELRGSFRGYIPIDTMSQMPHVTFAQGHDTGAYGIALDTSKSQNLTDFRAEIDKMDISIDQVVVAEFGANNIPKVLFTRFNEHKDLWGQQLPKPQFSIYGIRVNSNAIKELANNTLKIVYDDYEIMFFNADLSKFHLGEDKDLIIDIVGELNINKWYKTTNQIVVNDYEIKEVTNTFEDLI